MAQPTGDTGRTCDQPRGSAPGRPPTPSCRLTGGITTIAAALIGLAGTIAAAGCGADGVVAGTPHPPDRDPAALPTSAGTTSGGGTRGTDGSDTDGAPGPGRYRLMYEQVSFNLPFPVAMCEDPAVTGGSRTETTASAKGPGGPVSSPTTCADAVGGRRPHAR